MVHKIAKSTNNHCDTTGHYGDLSACTHNVYQALSPPLKGPGYETTPWPNGQRSQTIFPHAGDVVHPALQKPGFWFMRLAIPIIPHT